MGWAQHLTHKENRIQGYTLEDQTRALSMGILFRFHTATDAYLNQVSLRVYLLFIFSLLRRRNHLWLSYNPWSVELDSKWWQTQYVISTPPRLIISCALSKVALFMPRMNLCMRQVIRVTSLLILVLNLRLISLSYATIILSLNRLEP